MDNMENFSWINSLLSQGEQILWRGKPERYSLLNKKDSLMIHSMVRLRDLLGALCNYYRGAAPVSSMGNPLCLRRAAHGIWPFSLQALSASAQYLCDHKSKDHPKSRGKNRYAAELCAAAYGGGAERGRFRHDPFFHGKGNETGRFLLFVGFGRLFPCWPVGCAKGYERH